MRTHLAIPLLLCAAPLLMAADDAPAHAWFHDVRLTIGSLPTGYHAELEDKTTDVTTDGSDSFDSGGWFAADYQATVARTDLVGFTFGGGLDLLGHSQDENGVKDTLGGIGVHLDVGVAIHPVSFFTLEGTLLCGMGGAAEKVEFGNGNPDLESDSGSYAMFAALVRGVFIVGHHVELFAQGGYVAMNTVTKFDATPTNDQLENRYRIRGGTFGLGAGWRF